MLAAVEQRDVTIRLDDVINTILGYPLQQRASLGINKCMQLIDEV